MQLSVFGLGYVGTVTAACFAHDGHRVFGVDVADDRVRLLNEGRSPVIEDKIDELVQAAVVSGRLTASTNADDAVRQSDMAIVCVGTPSTSSGGLDMQYLTAVARQIGAAMGRRSDPFLIVVRSTVVPGTVGTLIPLLEEASGKTAGTDFDVLFHPEFLREGSSVDDFFNPPKIVIGERTAGAASGLLTLYEGYEAPRFVTTLEVAESVKYADNLFHAVKITFANEIGQFCDAHGVNSAEVMDIFAADTKLNISPKYLRPGFAFGGSCLPKDLRAFLSASRREHLQLPMLESVLPSNTHQVERAVRLVLDAGADQVGFVGLAFKPGTDDLRESPLVELAERLLGKGVKLCFYDEKVELARLVGKNRAYVDRHLPHLADLLVPSLDDLAPCEVIVVGHPAAPEQLEVWLQAGKQILDLSSAFPNITHPNYRRIV